MSTEDEVFETDKAQVMVARFLDPSEAQMAKGMLETSGIEVVLDGENANAIVPMAFRVRLMVRAADERAARELLGDVALGADDGE